MLYRYKALKKEKVITGTIDAANEKEAITYLRHNGLMALEVVRTTTPDSLMIVNALFNRVTFTDVVNLTRQLAIMLNAGLTLVDAFDIVKKQITKSSLLNLVESIDKEIRSGSSFSDALKKYPYLFSNLYIALVRSGEASGKLSEVLNKLAENLEKQREFNAKVKGAMTYPAIVMVGMVTVMFIMITFVIPKLLDLYKDLKVELPVTTQILIAVSGFSAKYWPIIVGIAIGLAVLFQNYRKTRQGKFMMDTIMLRLPVISSVVRMSALVDATRTLSILIGSGVSILEGLSIVTDTAGNLIFQEAFKNIYKELEKGGSLGASMAKEKVFPPILVQMATVGEQTGHLDETLLKISHYFELESELAVKALTSLIEPAIIIILGVGVGALVMSVITPIYNITNQL